MGDLDPAIQLGPLIVGLDQPVLLGQLAVLLIDLPERHIGRGVDILLQLVKEAALDHGAGQVGHQVVPDSVRGSAEDLRIIGGEQQLQALGVDLGHVDIIGGGIPGGAVPVIVVVVAQLMDDGGEVVEIAAGLIEHKGGAVAVEHGGEAHALLGLTVTQVVHLLAAHEGQSLGKLTGHLTDIGLDHIQRHIAGVVLGKYAVAGLVGVQGGKSLIGGDDIVLHSLVERLDLLLRIVAVIDHSIGIVAVVGVAGVLGDLIADSDHPQENFSQRGVLRLDDLGEKGVAGLLIQGAHRHGGIDSRLVHGLALVVRRIGLDSGSLILCDQVLLLGGKGELLVSHGLVAEIVGQILLAELLRQEAGTGGIQQLLDQDAELVHHDQIGGVGVDVLLHVGFVGDVAVGQDVGEDIHGRQLHQLIGQGVKLVRNRLLVVPGHHQGADLLHCRKDRFRVDVPVLDLIEGQLRVGLGLKKIGFPDLRCHRPGAERENKGNNQCQRKCFLLHLVLLSARLVW